MPWRTTNVLEQRRLFIARMLLGEESFTELCEEFGIPRKTGYKWRARYLEGGMTALADLSRRPKRFREQTPNDVIFEIIRIKHWKSSWGARKIRDYLRTQQTFEALPHSRTIDRYLRRCGFVTPRPQTWRAAYNCDTLVEAVKPNDVWTVDHKGWWRTNDGRRCEPLTVMDRHSRTLLNLSAHRTPTFEGTKERFIGLFEDYGLPLVVRSDNGIPFASVMGLHRLTRFSVWLLKLGILPNRMDPASPQQNGRHERLHRDIKRELQAQPAANLNDEQQRFDLWRHEYNCLRPHEALGGDTPIKHYTRSPRVFKMNTQFEYPADFKLRKVTANGDISWNMATVRIAKAMAGEYIGLEDCGEPDLKVWFCDFCLGTLIRKEAAFTPSKALVRSEIGRRVTT